MKRPTIALNGRFSGTEQPTGTQIVAYHLFDSIVKSPRDFDLVIFADPAMEGVSLWGGYPGTKVSEVPFRKWTRVRSQMWEQTMLPLEVKSRKYGLVHHPIMTCPRWNLGVTTVVTLHDLNFFHRPEWIAPRFRRWLMNTAVPGIRKASHIVAISDYVLADMRKTLGLSHDRTSRIYNGVEPMSVELAASVSKQPIILGVNLWQPHKNLKQLLSAFQLLRARIPKVELHLAGRPQAHYQNSPELINFINLPRVRVLGYLSDAELKAAYAHASVCCYPSLEEGFGLPVLEAMSAGVPVVTSNLSCLPEIAGGAAILINPYSSTDIAEGLFQALSENSLERNTRIMAGKKVAARFTWQEAARQYLKLYERLLS